MKLEYDYVHRRSESYKTRYKKNIYNSMKTPPTQSFSLSRKTMKNIPSTPGYHIDPKYTSEKDRLLIFLHMVSFLWLIVDFAFSKLYAIFNNLFFFVSRPCTDICICPFRVVNFIALDGAATIVNFVTWEIPIRRMANYFEAMI